MPEISYVYPNLAQVFLGSTTRRGGLSERWVLAQETGCEYIELPGTLIKNKTEEREMSLDIGDFLSDKEIMLLYSQDASVPEGLKYILHTEPSLSKENRYGRKIQPPIRWCDNEWATRYIEMILAITRFLNYPASVIEIHPGYKDNNYKDIANFIERLLDSYYHQHRFYPLILLENRTEQFISTGKDIKAYWEFIVDSYPSLVKHTGVVLDVQQLYTKVKGKFIEEYSMIPDECLKAFHIHTKHKWLKLSDEIPWRFVFGRIRELSGNVLINPEIHQKNRVQQVIKFCVDLLSIQ